MSGHDVRITAPDKARYQCFIAGEVLPPRPAIILFSAIFGADDDMKQMAQRWVDRGYLVAVPDYYHRIAPGILDRSEEGRKAAVARWMAVDVDLVIADVRPLKDHLLSLPSCNGKVAALGVCAGGELAFLAAARLGIQAAAAFHGTHIDRHLDEADAIGVPVTLHYGEADTLVPAEKVAAVKVGLEGRSSVEIHVYPGAEHGFSFPGRPSYHEAAATGADLRAQAIFGALKVPA
jgi:carboxymethylenebutenolidase